MIDMNAKPRPQPQPSDALTDVVPPGSKVNPTASTLGVIEGGVSDAYLAARQYADCGIYVYPVWQGGEFGGKPKAPACGHGYKDGTTDDAKLRRWWRPDTSLGVAMRTGVFPDGPLKDMCLLVIDIDDKDAIRGSEMLRRYLDGELDGKPHVLPPTLEQRSWSGGKHLFYLSEKWRGCTANAHLHIDIRGNGGGIVVAPTRITMPDGRSGQYEWVGGFDPSRIAEADAEVEALLDFVFDYRGKKREPASSREVPGRVPYVRPEHVSCGGRHGEIVRFAASRWARGDSEAEVLLKTLDFVSATCEQPDGDEMSIDEVTSILDWVFTKSRGSGSSDGGGPKVGPSEQAPTVEDGPSEGDKAMRRYVKKLLRKYEVWTTETKGDAQKVEFHPDRMIEAMLYGMHACTIAGAPAIWDGERYRFGPEVLLYIIELARPNASYDANRGLVKKLLARLEIERRFDLPSPCLVRFENGVLDLAEGEFRPQGKYSWRERIPNEVPHPLDLTAEPVPEVDRWLDTLSDGHEDVRRNLLQVVFLCMTRFTRHEQAVVLIGDGANGKSKFVDVLVCIVGEQNASSLGLGRMSNRFEVGDLAGKLLNVSSDISASYLGSDDAATWKQITGGDPVKADVKNLSGFVFRSYAQLVISANRFPKIAGGIDKATARRLHVIPFTHSFRNADGSYSDDADPGVVEKICQPDALAYLIRLAVEEGTRLLDEREFKLTTNYASLSEVHKMAVDNSSVLAWAEHVDLTERDLHMQRRQHMYDRYSAWCKRASLKAVADTRFADEVKTRFPQVETMKVRACRYEMRSDGSMVCGPRRQYNAFVIKDLYEREIAEQVKYAEVMGYKDTVTSYTTDTMSSTRETHRLDEARLGVWPEMEVVTDDVERRRVIHAKLWANLERYEE